jgi:hypothetical protein
VSNAESYHSLLSYKLEEIGYSVAMKVVDTNVLSISVILGLSKLMELYGPLIEMVISGELEVSSTAPQGQRSEHDSWQG